MRATVKVGLVALLLAAFAQAALASGGGIVPIDSMALASAQASGVAPEKPVIQDCAPISAEGEVCGVLNPNSSAEVDYYFAYDDGSSCEGGYQTLSETAAGRNVAVSARLASLMPATRYSYCLVASNAFGETLSDPASFETPPSLPQEPITEACSGTIQGGRQGLCGTLNPGFTDNAGFYFAYNSGTSCLGGKRTVQEAEIEGKAVSVSAEIANLAPGTEYTYCLVATNPFGETLGRPLRFATQALPVIEIERAMGIGPTDATLSAVVNPEGLAVSYHFEIAKAPACLPASPPLAPCDGTESGNLPEASLPASHDAHPVSLDLNGAGIRLEPGVTYSFRLLAESSAGVSRGAIEAFTTPQGSCLTDASPCLLGPAEAQSLDIRGAGSGTAALDSCLRHARRAFHRALRLARGKHPRGARRGSAISRAKRHERRAILRCRARHQ